jgi:hypothetical protein
MVLGIGIEQPPNHSLVLRMVLSCFRLEEIDATPAQGDRDLHAFVAKHQILGTRKKVRNDS